MHDVSQLCEDSARRFAADRVRAEEKVIALGEWCRKMTPEYDAVKCATAAAAVDLEALVFRTEGEVLLKECTQVAPEGEQRKAAAQFKLKPGMVALPEHEHLDVVLPVVVDMDALFADVNAYIQSLENSANLNSVDVNQLLTRYNESVEFLSASLKAIAARLKEILRNLE